MDPIQARLIAAHVTLCREDELDGLDPALLDERMSSPEARPVTLQFGAPVHFDEHGILLPCVAGEGEFHALRQKVLADKLVRRQVPHITLAHPRNPRAPGNSLLAAASLASGIRITFGQVSLIRQQGFAPWQTLRTFQLGSRGTPITSIDAAS